MIRQILALTALETGRLLRSRVAFSLLLLVPALQVVLFGYAVNPTGGRVTVAVAGLATAPLPRIVRAVEATPSLTLIGPPGPPGAAEEAVRRGAARIGIEAAPPDAPNALVVFVDAGNPALTANAVARIEGAYWKSVGEIAGLDKRAKGVAWRFVGAPESRSDWAFLSGLVGVTVMISMIMLGALSIAREREGGQWETLRTLPIGPLGLMIGKLAPYAAIGAGQGLLVLVAGRLLFGLPLPGAVLALVALLPVYAFANLAIGFAIAARAENQLVALQGGVAAYLPAMLLSGFLYPRETMPHWARLLSEIFPLTHMIAASRGVILQGWSASAVFAEAAPIALIAALAAAAGYINLVGSVRR